MKTSFFFSSSRTAFFCWLLANILLCMPVILYAGYMTLAAAAFIFCSMASFSTTMNVPQCVFSIGNDSFEAQYSHSFWLALATGTDQKVFCTSADKAAWSDEYTWNMSSRRALHRHWNLGGDAELHDAGEDKRGVQRRRGQLRGWGCFSRGGLPEFGLPWWSDHIAVDTESNCGEWSFISFDTSSHH